MGLGWGLFLLVARTQRSKSAASRGPLYFAWGCFRDFLSSEQIDRTKTHPALGSTAMATQPERLELLSALARKVLWLSSWTIHHANHIRPNADGLKVGGHQASSASLATIMSALYFSVLRPEDRVAVKPHASPVFHAIQYPVSYTHLR